VQGTVLNIKNLSNSIHMWASVLWKYWYQLLAHLFKGQNKL